RVVTGGGKAEAIRTERDAVDMAAVTTQKPHLIRRPIPDVDGRIFSPESDQAAVWAERHAADATGVPRQSAPFLGGPRLQRPRIPDAQGLTPTCRNQPTSIRTEGDRGDAVSVAPQRQDVLAGREVPDPHQLIEAGGSEPPAVRAERHTLHNTGVPAEGVDRPTRRGVPDDHFTFAAAEHGPAARREQPAVGAEGHALYPFGVPFKRAQELTSLCVPEFHRPVHAPTGGAEQTAIRAVHHAGDTGGVPAESEQLFAGVQAPYVNGAANGRGEALTIGADGDTDD